MAQQIDTIIVGAGLSGLSIAHKLRTSCYGHRYMVLEKSESTGGVIRSHHENGFIAENGPHGFLDNCSESNAILEEIGLDKECIKSPLMNFVRYVYLHGALQVIPQTPLKILFAPLIPWSAKLRVLADLFKEPLPGEPTVAKWVNHRFGPALLPFADAVFTGTYAGDINSLTINAVMPAVRELEMQHGSVIRGLFAKSRRAKKNKFTHAKKFTMPAMTSFASGMARLPERLTEFLEKDKSLMLNCEVTKICSIQDQWQVTTNRGEFCAANIVLAVPTNTALSLLQSLSTPPPQQSIAESAIATVVLGFGEGEKLPPGFGFLTPESENRFSLGTLFSSNMFPGRAPEGHILFETLVGGTRHPERIELDDDELIQRGLADVRDILGLKSEPCYSRVLRPWGNIPQLENGYPELLAWRDSLVKDHNGLYISGFGWEGIGLNDMMKSAVKISRQIQQGTGNARGKADIKGVYF